MAKVKKGTAQSLFHKLEVDRMQYIEDGIACAELTIPSLFPKNFEGNTKLPRPYQSVGARGVNNLASKMMLALLPPNTSIFRMKMEDEVIAQLSQRENIKTKVEEGLASVERRATSEIQTKAIHAAAFEIFKHLVVVGNVLVYVPDIGDIRSYSLHSYVVRRDTSGNCLDIVVREKVARVTLPQETQEKLKLQDKHGDKGNEEVVIFTHVRRLTDRWEAYQEVAGERVPGTYGTYPLDKCPWIPLRLIKQDGRNYGRSYVDEYLGDLISLDGLSQALFEGSVAAAKVLFLVNPNGTTEKQDLQDAANGDFVDGSDQDVKTLQLNKASDFRVTHEQANVITERLSYAFLLNSAVQRGGDRVTAEEIRYVARELEDALGGLYSLLSKEFQLPLVSRVIYVLQKQKKLPPFPKEAVKPVIITGMEALGRGNDLAKLELAMSKVIPLGMEIVSKYFKVKDYVDRVFTACGVDTKGLIKSDEEVQADEQREQQMAMIAQGLPNAVAAGGKLLQQGMAAP